MKITIVGGGNIGTQFAVHCAEKGHLVSIYTSEPELFNGHLDIVDETGETTHEGDILCATDDPAEAFSNADLILITMPAIMMQDISTIIEKYIDPDSKIGIVPGNGGWECAFRRSIEKGNVVFGLERVPAIARLVQKGKTVRAVGYRKELHVAALPKRFADECTAIIESIFDIRCRVVPSYLNLTLTPSNPIIHTTRLYTLFRDWHEGMFYEHIPLFYEEWDNASSKLMMECDEEVQKICRALPDFHLEYVKSLRDHYESYTVDDMTRKISSIDAFKGLKTPMKEVKEGLIPDLHSRYFSTDFPFGLSIIYQVAGFADVSVPRIEKVLHWYSRIADEKRVFRFEDYGIYNRQDFNMFYLQ